jgi:RNA polymerase sigma-70 factor (ECF subfamily)
VGVESTLPHIPRLRRYARLLTGDPVRADDLVQDTLERACRKWSLWQPRPDGSGLRGWLLSLMHNVHLNQIRDHGRDDWHDELDETTEPVHEPLSHVPERLDLERALARLSPSARQVVLLVCVEELSYADAAQILGVPVGTVMSRLSRAREHLRQLMAGEPASVHRDAPPLKVVR